MITKQFKKQEQKNSLT